MSMYYRQLMQERLDGQLDDEQAEELLHHLAEDADAAEENARLERAHELLAKAPAMRAPERLAATIMARIAQTVRAEARQQGLEMDIQLALLLSISTVTISMMPLMVASSYMVVNTWRSPALLVRAAHRVIAMQSMMIDGLIILIDEAQALASDGSHVSSSVALSLVPVVMQGMLDAVQADMEIVIARAQQSDTPDTDA